MDVTLHEAAATDLHVVRNLVPYYVYDMSEYMGWACWPDGTFTGCDGVESFWSMPRRFAFVLRSGDEPAGFAMVRGDYDDDGGDDDDDNNTSRERGPRAGVDYSIAEFFVLRKFRRRGVGETVARQLFDRFPGRWMIEHLAGNTPALRFWKHVVTRYCGDAHEQHVEKSGFGDTIVLRFDNRARGDAAREL